MPQPPVLPTIDWQNVFASGRSYEDWIDGGEPRDNVETIARLLDEQRLEPQHAALLTALPRKVHVVAIAEPWCGDVVRHVPVLVRLAEGAPKLDVRFVTRDQYHDVFARFLTNGGEAIPKFVFLSEQFVECGNWGPMPEACRELIARGKACDDVSLARDRVSTLYAADPDRSEVVRELLALIDIAACTAP